VLPSLKQPETLAKLPQHWFLAPGWNNPYVRPPILPRELTPGTTVAFDMELAPPAGGWSKAAHLRLQFAQAPEVKTWRLRLNDTELTAEPDVTEPFATPFPTMLGEPETLRAWTVPAAALRDGVNKLEVTMVDGQKVKLMFVDLVVK
jgi:hypothetical protein